MQLFDVGRPTPHGTLVVNVSKVEARPHFLYACVAISVTVEERDAWRRFRLSPLRQLLKL